METNKKVDVGFIWQVTDSVLRDTFKKNEIGDVVLPFVVIRRLDCILEPVNTVVRDTEIVNHIESCTSKIDKISEELKVQIEKLKEYKTAIISEAVTGKIDLREWIRPKI